jgi:hypothetical protein
VHPECFCSQKRIEGSGRAAPRLFLVFFIALGFFHHTVAMELSDVLVEIPQRQSLWCARYSEDIKNIPDVAGLQKRRHLLKEKRCLSSDASQLEQLLYLSTINKDGEKSKTPFTCTQQKKFDHAEGIKRWVPRCFCINAAVIVTTACAGLTSALGLLTCSNETSVGCLSSTQADFIPAPIGWLLACVVGGSSLYATGISPYLASKNADKVQDLINDLHHHYSTIAKYWIDMYFSSPEKARCLADMFDIEELKNRAKIKTCKKNTGDNLVSSLEEACHFIKTGNVLPKLTVTENYIRNEINRRQIELLEKTIAQQKNKKQMKRKRYAKK